MCLIKHMRSEFYIFSGVVFYLYYLIYFVWGWNNGKNIKWLEFEAALKGQTRCPADSSFPLSVQGIMGIQVKWMMIWTNKLI